MFLEGEVNWKYHVEVNVFAWKKGKGWHLTQTHLWCISCPLQRREDEAVCYLLFTQCSVLRNELPSSHLHSAWGDRANSLKFF